MTRRTLLTTITALVLGVFIWGCLVYRDIYTSRVLNLSQAERDSAFLIKF